MWLNSSTGSSKYVQKNVKFVAIRCVFFKLQIHQNLFWVGLCPGTHWGSLQHSPNLQSTPSLLDTFGVSISVPTASWLSLVRPLTQIPGYYAYGWASPPGSLIQWDVVNGELPHWFLLSPLSTSVGIQQWALLGCMALAARDVKWKLSKKVLSETVYQRNSNHELFL